MRKTKTHKRLTKMNWYKNKAKKNYPKTDDRGLMKWNKRDTAAVASPITQPRSEIVCENLYIVNLLSPSFTINHPVQCHSDFRRCCRRRHHRLCCTSTHTKKQQWQQQHQNFHHKTMAMWISIIIHYFFIILIESYFSFLLFRTITAWEGGRERVARKREISLKTWWCV